METHNYYNFYDEKTIFKKTNTTPSFTYGLSSLSQKSKINPEIVEVCMLHISNQRKQRGYTIEPEQFWIESLKKIYYTNENEEMIEVILHTNDNIASDVCILKYDDKSKKWILNEKYDQYTFEGRKLGHTWDVHYVALDIWNKYKAKKDFVRYFLDNEHMKNGIFQVDNSDEFQSILHKEVKKFTQNTLEKVNQLKEKYLNQNYYKQVLLKEREFLENLVEFRQYWDEKPRFNKVYYSSMEIFNFEQLLEDKKPQIKQFKLYI